MTLRLVIFDVDGTLVDSQGDIHACMTRAFAAEGLEGPSSAAVRAIVGLSLPQAMAVLASESDVATQARLVDGYKASYADARRKKGAADSSPLFPGAKSVIQTLHGQDDVLLAIATGKSRRGLDFLLEAHDLGRYFISTQVADNHPSKPHPSMVEAALRDSGVDNHSAVVIGDTTYDMDMAHAAGVRFVGVAWGYHTADKFNRALAVLEDFASLPEILNQHWSAP